MGLEPTTSCVTGRRSNRLRYNPKREVALPAGQSAIAQTATAVLLKDTILFASVVCLSKQVSVITHNTLSKPLRPHEWRRGESNSCPRHRYYNLFLRRGKPSVGLEPTTYGLQNRCSIQLSYTGVKGSAILVYLSSANHPRG